MGIIYFIIKVLAFPGTMFKAFLEHLACRMYSIPVEYSKYMQKNELCGHVEHLFADHKGSFGICFLPHIITLICGLAFTLPASMNLFYLGKLNLFSCIFLYFGLAFLLNLFPLIEDAANMWDNLYHGEAKLVSKICLAAPAAIMYAGAYLERYCVTLITSVGFAYGVSYLMAFIIEKF